MNEGRKPYIAGNWKMNGSGASIEALLDDVVTTGGSTIQAIEAYEEAGAEVLVRGAGRVAVRHEVLTADLQGQLGLGDLGQLTHLSRAEPAAILTLHPLHQAKTLVVAATAQLHPQLAPLLPAEPVGHEVRPPLG